MRQFKFANVNDIAGAEDIAITISREGKGYGCVIKSENALWVEDEPPLVRAFETLVSEFENGERIIQS